MRSSTQPTSEDAADALRRALEAGDEQHALSALETLGRAVPPDLLVGSADLCMRHRRWRQAGRLLNRVIDRDAACEASRRTCRNLAALETHRPEVYAAVVATGDPGPYQPVDVGGVLSIVHNDPDGTTTLISGQADPRAGLKETLTALADLGGADQPLALCSVGDGYLLSHLAAHPDPLFLTQTRAIYVFERDPRLLLACLSVHDLTGPTGPIEQERFVWFVGPDGVDRFRATLSMVPFLSPPAAHAAVGFGAQGMPEEIQAAVAAASRDVDACYERVVAYYDGIAESQLKQRFGFEGDRPPRALVFTTRFSTVLQHSARDTVDGFDRLGWDAQLLIEPADHHRMTRAALVQAVERFKPDLVLVIDHLRREYPGVFPPALPFVCSIQDHLPNLTSPEAGASIGRNDFVLTSVGPMYADHHGYPRRNLIELTKMTRVPDTPPPATPGAEDLVYVSNAGQPIAELVDQTLAMVADAPGVRPLVEACIEALLAVYRDGGAAPMAYDLGQIVDRATAEAGVVSLDPVDRSRLIALLGLPLNNALYRQQAVGWVAEAAADRGMSLGLYGQGWDRHDRFGAYARGPVAYGAPLESLTRSASINLQIVPSLCLHQRLLDGLVAGGFFLIRQHTADTLIPRFASFLEAEGLGDAASVAQVRDRLSGDPLERLEALLVEARPLTELGQAVDPVEWVQGCRRSGLVDGASVVLPELGAVSFDGPESLVGCLDRFAADAGARQHTAALQRASVADRFSYEAGMARILGRIADRLDDGGGG